jgi:hypothetical protein
MLLLKNVPNICGREIRNFRVQGAESGVEANTLLDWEKFRPIEDGLYDNKTERGGHPNIDFG